MPAAEPLVSCPNCRAQIKLTESLAAPLVEATRRDFERRLAAKETECAGREAALATREEQFVRQKDAHAAHWAEKLQAEQARIAAEEAKLAQQQCALELDSKSREIASLNQVLRARESKLAEAQRAQAEVLVKQRALEDAQRELELTVEKRVRENVAAVRRAAQLEADEQSKLRLLEKEQVISSMQKQIENLRRKAEQGSQQLQGEAQELELESILSASFPFDTIEPVRKGEHGGDILQRVQSAYGCCGTILWEAKRTKNWSDNWLVKLREDQRTAKADLAVIVSQVLPKGIENFELVEGVWVLHPRLIAPVAFSLRHMLAEIAEVRQASQGQQTKAEMVYQYLTGSRFRQRIQAIVEAFTSLRDDLDRERKALMKQWAKREEQIDRVMRATLGMYGDLQGIAGTSVAEIEGLSLETLSGENLSLIA